VPRALEAARAFALAEPRRSRERLFTLEKTMRYAALLLLALPFSAFAESPLSLTASDGSGLKLVSMNARGVVEDPLAFTELTLTFENPQDRVIEGQFRITLPRGATVSRFAMKLDGRWQEGEVVERQAARRAYEDFLHRRQDPALLEQGAANEFTARVFPIPARGQKELIVSYSQELVASDAAYVLPLKGLPQVGALDVAVYAAGTTPVALKKTGWVPDADLVVKPPRSGRTGARAGELVVARVKPVASSLPEPLDSVLVLVDTSASRALGFTAQSALVQKLVDGIAKAAPATPLTVAAFDQTVQVVHEGPASGYSAEAAKKLKDRRALGASDVEAALKFAAKAKRARVVLVTDGVATAGNTEGGELAALAKSLKASGITRLDAVAVGGIRDDASLHLLVTAGLPHDGSVIDGDLEASVILRKLGEGTRSKLKVAVEGARFVWPTVFDGVQAGDERLVYAELPAGQALNLSIGGQAVAALDKGLAQVAQPLLERAVAQARIAALVDQMDRVADGPKQKAELQQKVVDLSVKFRVLSPYTALLVLETEADYARFQIDRRALADILTVTDGQVRLNKRKALDTPPPPEKPVVVASKPRDDSSDMKKGGVEKISAAPSSPAPSDEPAPAAQAAAPPGATQSGGDEMKESAKMDAAPEREERPSPRPAPPPPSVAMVPQRDSASRGASEGAPALRREAAPRPAARPAMASEVDSDDSRRPQQSPYTGQFKDVMDQLAAGKTDKALATATGWREEQPGDVLALVALGEAFEAKGDLERAARSYGSLIDLFPSRADLRRFAGVRLERIKNNAGLSLASDTFAKAAQQRPDHPASHRLLAFTLVREGKFSKAFDAIEAGATRSYPSGRFAGVDRILREDMGLVGAAWLKAEPGQAAAIRARLEKAGAQLETAPSLRFVLNWETDANDVDFHIHDGRGGHAYYSSRQLPGGGGELYADVTTGYGPECFTIRLPPGQRVFPYKLQAHYYSRGPMGYGMGKLEIIEHDGKGGLKLEERPYVVMVDQAFVDLGIVKQ
jgi:tetratricopeptide (TPR) repeat protein